MNCLIIYKELNSLIIISQAQLTDIQEQLEERSHELTEKDENLRVLMDDMETKHSRYN